MDFRSSFFFSIAKVSVLLFKLVRKLSVGVVERLMGSIPLYEGQHDEMMAAGLPDLSCLVFILRPVF